MFGGGKLSALPHFRPESTERSPEEQELLAAVRAADGLIIGTPGYHAGVSGLVKNAIDLLEDTRTDDRVYFDGLGVGLIVAAAGSQALGATLGAMRAIVAAMRGWSAPIAITVNTVTQQVFDNDSGKISTEFLSAVEGQASQVMGLAIRHCQARADKACMGLIDDRQDV
jgi:FMN reductase